MAASSPTSEAFSAEFVRNVSRVQRALYTFILSLVRKAADAEDVLQETNLVLWQKAADFQPGSDFLAWALRIAQLQSLSCLQKRRRTRVTADDALLRVLADEAKVVVLSVDARRDALTRCLERLTSEQQELISRRYEPGGSVQRLAEQRGSTPKALSEMLRRIRKRLQDCIERRLLQEGHA